MPYIWDNIAEDNFEKLPVGRQTLVNYFVYESQNINGSPYLAFKFARPKDCAKGFTSYDDNGCPRVYPNATLQVYYEAKNDFGIKVLKQLLKAEFGEDRLNVLNTNEKIIHTVNKEKPLVSGLVYFEKDNEENEYCKLKKLNFEPVNTQIDNIPSSVVDSPSPNLDNGIEDQADEDDDLPF